MITSDFAVCEWRHVRKKRLVRSYRVINASDRKGQGKLIIYAIFSLTNINDEHCRNGTLFHFHPRI